MDEELAAARADRASARRVAETAQAKLAAAQKESLGLKQQVSHLQNKLRYVHSLGYWWVMRVTSVSNGCVEKWSNHNQSCAIWCHRCRCTHSHAHTHDLVTDRSLLSIKNI